VSYNSSDVGKTGGRQTVSVADACVHLGVVLHVMMHALGFWHEESRPDRDNFVSIQTGNIAGGMKKIADVMSLGRCPPACDHIFRDVL